LADSFAIQILDLLAASSLEFRSFIDLRDDDFAMSSDVLWFVQNLTNGGLSEILRIESLLVDNSIYLRIPQLLESFFGMDLVSDVEFSMLENIFVYENQIPIADLVELMLEQENEFRALVSDVTNAFFDNLVNNMSVEYDVPVTVGGGVEYFNKVVINGSADEFMTSILEALKVIRDNDEYLILLLELDKLINPRSTFTVEDIRVLIDTEIEFLEFEIEIEAELFSDETADIYIYIDETDLVVGFGIEMLFDDFIFEVVFVEDIGFHFIVDDGIDTIRIYGTHSAGTVSRGDLHVFYRDFWSEVIEGKVLDFEYSANHFTMTLSGRDFLHLYTGEVISPEEDTLSFVAELMYNLELTLTLEGDNESVNLSLTVRHLDPEISITLELYYALSGDISIERPSGENVIYLDIFDMMYEEGNEIEAVLSEIDPFELFANLAQIFDNLTQQGFDFTELLADLMLGLM
jgi:hypothetical protein